MRPSPIEELLSQPLQQHTASKPAPERKTSGPPPATRMDFIDLSQMKKNADKQGRWALLKNKPALIGIAFGLMAVAGIAATSSSPPQQVHLENPTIVLSTETVTAAQLQAKEGQSIHVAANFTGASRLILTGPDGQRSTEEYDAGAFSLEFPADSGQWDVMVDCPHSCSVDLKVE